MEKRCFERNPLQIHVLMHYGPLGLINGVTKNISSCGMFVDTGRIILCSDTTIELSFRYPDQYEGNIYTLDAHIVHTTETGAGLHFVDFRFLPSQLGIH